MVVDRSERLGMMNRGEEDEAVKEEILAISRAWAKAIVSNDADDIGSYMADDWIMVSEMGVATKEHFLSFVRSGQLTHSSMELIELASIRVYGDTAIFAGRVTNTACFGADTYHADEWTSDVFVRSAGEWKCVMTHYTSVKQMEGK